MPQGHAACAQPELRSLTTALVNREIVVPAILSRGDASDQRVMLGTRCDLRLDGDNRALRDIDRFKALPIIVVSNKNCPEGQQKILEAVADRYVTKPEFDTDAMLDLVAELLST